PSFDALSYVWGPPTSSHHILLNDHSVPITKNLHTVLLRLRSDELRILWIDQLCIDQSNLEERSSQVRLMGKIYESAKEVVMWLGPDPSAS
ncbi:heterokaryon incompatibility, partial [Mytilinidion resinicola]